MLSVSEGYRSVWAFLCFLCLAAPHRLGEIAECWADPGKAAMKVGWQAELSLEDMMQDIWRRLADEQSGWVQVNNSKR